MFSKQSWVEPKYHTYCHPTVLCLDKARLSKVTTWQLCRWQGILWKTFPRWLLSVSQFFICGMTKPCNCEHYSKKSTKLFFQCCLFLVTKVPWKWKCKFNHCLQLFWSCRQLQQWKAVCPDTICICPCFRKMPFCKWILVSLAGNASSLLSVTWQKMLTSQARIQCQILLHSIIHFSCIWFIFCVHICVTTVHSFFSKLPKSMLSLTISLSALASSPFAAVDFCRFLCRMPVFTKT